MGLRNKLSLQTFKKFFSGGTPGGFALGQFGGGASIANAYAMSAVAYASIRRISMDVSGAPMIFLSDPNDPTSAVPENHPTRVLFSRPNQSLSQSQFIEYLVMWLELRGEFFVTFDDPDNPTVMVPTIDPLRFRTLKGNKGELDGFEARVESRELKFMPAELIHHRFINPADPYRGMSPLQSAAHALNIDIKGDTLAADIVDRGGETGLVYKTEEDLLPEQQDELQTALKARRKEGGRIPLDMLLTGGLTISDPKFTAFDYKIFERLPVAQQKITMVYGLSPSLLGHDNEPNFATFEGRLKIYWHQTLLPVISGIESAFDVFFAHLKDPCYVRWDRRRISGLAADLRAQAETAGILQRAKLPWGVINGHLNMGLPVDDIPGADEIMIPQTNAPLSQLLIDWQYQEPKPVGELSVRPGIPKDLTNEEIRRKATEPAAIIARDRKLGRIERATAKEWRSLNFAYRKKVLAIWNKAVADNVSLDMAYKEFAAEVEPLLVDDMADDAVDDIQPRQISAAEMGQDSIVSLVTRSTDNYRNKAATLSPKTLEVIASRENLIRGLTNQDLFVPIMEDVLRVISTEGEVGEVVTVAKRSLDAQGAIKAGFNVSSNRAKTIARTEVGTAFNVSRFEEMGTQGFKKHQWLAVGDDDSRETHMAAEAAGPWPVGDPFPSVDLAYPQDPGGPPEEVINCRCLTIPVLED